MALKLCPGCGEFYDEEAEHRCTDFPAAGRLVRLAAETFAAALGFALSVIV